LLLKAVLNTFSESFSHGNKYGGCYSPRSISYGRFYSKKRGRFYSFYGVSEKLTLVRISASEAKFSPAKTTLPQISHKMKNLQFHVENMQVHANFLQVQVNFMSEAFTKQKCSNPFQQVFAKLSPNQEFLH